MIRARWVAVSGIVAAVFSLGLSGCGTSSRPQSQTMPVSTSPSGTFMPVSVSSIDADDYWVLGAGGDLCLPGAIEYQTLHSDARETFELTPARLEQARRMGVELRTAADGAGLEDRARHLVFQRTPPRVTINFLMSDLTFENGPIRQIPGTQTQPSPSMLTQRP